ncbi:hypothetical protein BJY04DRAFT_229024 [Aspergillus karnatakaensis]|uniref:uncharacterized protein n=1 Tax=Aspergillus karnatakaensis TaxID=1810916 RepID=UPI003CCD7C8C
MDDERDSVALQPVPRPSGDRRPPTYRSELSINPNQAGKAPFSAHLHRSVYGPILAVIYAALAIAPWVIICILSFRPITADQYYATPDNYYLDAKGKQSLYRRNERWYHAARVLQAIAGIITLPLTSAICASAAVIYMQRNQTLTLRQTIALADREWMDLPGFFGLKIWKRYGSTFLYLSILLNILGLIISPLQAVFLSTGATKTPTQTNRMSGLFDMTDPEEYYREGMGNDGNKVIIMTRGALQLSTGDEPQRQLWRGANMSCDPLSEHYAADVDYCGSRTTINTMAGLSDPFVAELPADFNTGLFRQFAPRINTTAQYDPIPAAEFPENCNEIEGAFFVDYTNSTTVLDPDDPYIWGVQVCMPSNVTQSPWKLTRNRQDFSELTLDTTSGYFELPNYMNGGLAGPLLNEDPTELCAQDLRCKSQGFRNTSITRRQSFLSEPSNALNGVANKGPLLLIALALFGEGSFIASRARHTEAYATPVLHDRDDFDMWTSGACVEMIPLNWLDGRTKDSCIRNRDGGENGWDVADQIVDWLTKFHAKADTVAAAFTAAGFLANQARIRYNVPENSLKTLTVSYDLGADTKIPVISLAGVVFISILLGVHVLSLLALGGYAAWSPRWTGTLNSFAMMRLGSIIAPQLPLWFASGWHRVEVFDQTPGWIGAVTSDDGRVGELSLGEGVRLRKGREYASYHPDGM